MKLIRKLASIQVITSLQPIKGADFVEATKILGWNVVVKKGDFKVGDYVVYFETDSLLPKDNPDFDFLKNSKGKIKPLSPKRIRGVLSEGLALPITILKDYDGEITEGIDVTDFLKVVKYEIPEVFSPVLGEFPNFIHKTDETRIQVLQHKLDQCKDKIFVVTEKLDGTSFTAFIKNGKFGICSQKSLLSMKLDSLYLRVALEYDLENKFKELRECIPYDFALQGEIIGKEVQGNKYNLTKNEIRWFNFVNIDKQKDIGFYLSNADEFKVFNGFTLGMVAAMLDMETVPILDNNFKMTNDIDALLKLSEGKSMLNPNQEREGLVFRAKNQAEFDRENYDRRMSFKAINPVFLCPLL